MKVLGQLESAQLENLNGNPAKTPTGRVFADVTNPLAALPKFYDGSQWRTLGFSTSAAAFVSQNSGKAVVVNWATSLYQIVNLTDNAVISFINPQEAQVHTLIVRQAARGPLTTAVSTWQYTFDMSDQDVTRDRGPYQPLPIPLGKEKLHQWVYHSASQAAYTTVPGVWDQMGAAVVTAATPSSIDLPREAPDWFAVATTTTPFSNAYRLFPVIDSYTNPMGAQFTASTAAAAALLDGVYSPNGKFFAVVSGTSPFLQMYYTLNGAPAGGTVANPGTLPAGAAKAVHFHPSSNWIVCGHATTPFMSAYPITNGAFGTKIADPGVLPTAQVNSVRWSPHGDFLAAMSNSSPFLTVWPFVINSVTGAGTFGAKVNDPSVLPAATCLAQNHHQIAWRPQGDYIACCINASPWVYLVPFNRATASFGTPITFPALSGGASATAVEFSPDGQYLFVGANTTPFLYVYDMSTGSPVITTLDSSAPSTGCMGFVFHPSGDYVLWATSSSPKVSLLIPPNKQRNYVRIV